jgi:hypothetical protein
MLMLTDKPGTVYNTEYRDLVQLHMYQSDFAYIYVRTFQLSGFGIKHNNMF